MKYEFELDDYTKDLFEMNSDNVIEVRIRDESGNDLTDNAIVDIYLSKNGLLGLGTWLIRLAHDFKECRHFHLDPATQNNLVESLGVFLTPESAPLVIFSENFKPIDDYLSITSESNNDMNSNEELDDMKKELINIIGQLPDEFLIDIGDKMKGIEKTDTNDKKQLDK